MKYQCFYLSTIRCMFGMVRKNSTDLSQHHADHDLSVRENTVRNVWRASWRDRFPTLNSTFRIRYDFHDSGHACPAHHGERKVSRASPDAPDDHRRGPFRRRERHAHDMARRHKVGSGDQENPERGRAKIFRACP